MKNPRISKREQGLLKGAIRRVFSRSDLRRKVVEASVDRTITDPSRPRVKVWCICRECHKPTPKSYMIVDHKDPLIPLDSSFEDMSLDTVVDRAWCDENNLQALCEDCHTIKTKAENKERRRLKKEKKK
jgi:5-methylcytosine-specific restriction endonuclease McrA